jgi:multimeric flavodoxin WrbA
MTSKKIVVVKGSPRMEGNTSVLADQVVTGAEAEGAEVQVFYLHGMDIQPCDACDSCQASLETECVVMDDMHDIYPHLRAADALVIASPVYWFTVSAQTKIFMDRCYALGGADTDDHALMGKKVGIVMAYGDTDPYNSGAVNAFRTFQDGYDYIGAEIVGMVYGSADSAGEIRRNRELMGQANELGKLLGAAE